MNARIASLSMAAGLALAGMGANAAINDGKAQEILGKSACAACHQLDQKRVGPTFLEIARKHKGDKDAVATLMKKVRGGSAGAYGKIPMPPNPPSKISDADLKAVVEWVLSK